MFKRSFLPALSLLLLAACSQQSPVTNTSTNSAPTAVADSYTLEQGSRLEKSAAEGVLANDSDPEGETLKASLKQAPQHGELTLAKDGSFVYEHGGGDNSTDHFSYLASDGNASSLAGVKLTILTKDIPGTPDNAAPEALDDSYTLDEGETLTVAVTDGLLANDSNPENATLSIELLTEPEYGVLDIQADGSFSYIHDHSETTSDTFTYRISDGTATATAHVSLTITPVSDAPIVEKLELAQTHIVKPEGTRWESEKLQDRELHLVGNRAALALFDLSAANNRIVDAVVEAHVDGQKLGEAPLNSPETLPPTEAGGPAYSTTAHWVTLDKTWLKPGLELRVRANEGQLGEVQPINVGAPASFTMYTLPFYLFGLDESDIPFNQVAAPDSATQDEYFAKHPFAELEMVNHPVGKVKWPYIVVGPRQGRAAQRVTYKEQQGDGYAVMSATLGILHAIRNANGDAPTNNQYYAPLLMAKQNGSYSHPGGGLGGGNVGTGDYSYTGIFIHEAGHAFGMPHANDGYKDGKYPYVGGSLKGSSWGYDSVRGLFQPTFVPTSSGNYGKCKSWSIQFDAEGRCIKQDPMQSGSGYQAAGDKYTIFSDFNASVVQRYFEGLTTLNSDGSHKYSGGKIIQDASSPTGYSRWDTIDKAFVTVEPTTSSNGIWGLNKGLPIVHDRPVHTIIVTYSHTTPEASQIYPPLSYTGNLLETIDPTNSAQLASIKPNISEHAWYCHASGCDYTLRVTYADDSVQHIVLQGAFRKWHWSESGGTLKDGINDPTSSDSFKTWSVNIDGAKAIKRVELLDTPKVYDGMPSDSTVLLSHPAN